MRINYLSLTAIAAISLYMTSCSQGEDVTASTTGKQTVTFLSGEKVTRTSMGGNYTDANFPFYWEKNDAIWVNATDEIASNNSETASYALFTGEITTSSPYLIRYTGTGNYSSKNNLTNKTLTTKSDANTLVIPPIQTLSIPGNTVHFGATGDCGIATAAANNVNTYGFKLRHKAAYLIIMPRWPNNTAGNYLLKSIILTTHNSNYLLSGRFGFNENGIGSPVSDTNGSCTIKVNIANGGIILPTTTDQTKSINVVIKPIGTATSTPVPLYCIYEVYDGTNTYFIEKIISDKSFPENTITPITANIETGYKHAVDNHYLDLITTNNIYYNYNQWDAPIGEPYYVSHEMADNYNGTTISNDFTTVSTTTMANKGCADCPTYNEMSWYMQNGGYWDANKIWGTGEKEKGGMWFKKKAYLFSSGIVTEKNFTRKHNNKVSTNISGNDLFIGTIEEPKDLSDNWFFLPASGSYGTNGTLRQEGAIGDYWLSTPYINNGSALRLGFAKIGITVTFNSRLLGYGLWSAK
ncbi:MAG: hypothetical protein LKG25_05305 [Prevotella sp.]|nr:hypothetical protein [Prevotella sp.]MCI1281993.1 hypothetical protein [Prevotella sp.]